MKSFKTIALVSLLTLATTTSVFASWWNPFSWGMFKKNGVSTQQVSPIKYEKVEIEKEKVALADTVSTSSKSIENKSKIETTGTIKYVDTKWNFTLDFPKEWEGYIVSRETDQRGVEIIHFNETKVLDIFDLLVFPKVEWEKERSRPSEEQIFIPTYITEDNSHVYTFRNAHNGVYRSILIKDVDQVIKTFKRINKINETEIGGGVKSNVFTYPGIKVGQKYGSMTVEKIGAVTDTMSPKRSEPITDQNIAVTFSGNVLMRGSLYISVENDYMGPGYSLSFDSGADFLKEIPVMSPINKKERYTVPFSGNNKEVFNFIKENNFKTGDDVEIIIDKYYLNSHPSGAGVSWLNVISIKKVADPLVWGKYENKNRKFIISYPPEVTVAEVYRQNVIACFNRKNETCILSVNDKNADIVNDKTAYESFNLLELENKLHTKIKASVYDGNYSIELNNIVIVSRDKILLQQILSRIELAGVNEGVSR